MFNSLNEILGYTKNKEQQWVIQKYMENSLIVHERKVRERECNLSSILGSGCW